MRTCYLSVGLVASAFTASMAWSAEPEERLREILAQWKRASEANCTYHAKGTRFIYDRVFEIETRAAFEFARDESDRWVIRTEPMLIDKQEVSKKIGKQGTPYELRPDLSEVWYGDECVVRWLLENQREYLEFERRDSRDTTADHGFLANLYVGFDEFKDLLSVDAEGVSLLLERFDVSLVAEDENSVTMCAIPKTAVLRESVRALKLILDTRQFRVLAMQMTDITGNRETVFVYNEIEFNRQYDDNSLPFYVPWEENKKMGSGG